MWRLKRTVLYFQTPLISVMLHWSESCLCFGFFSPFFFYTIWILCLSLFRQAFTRATQVDLHAHPFSEHLYCLPVFPPKETSCILSRSDKNGVFFANHLRSTCWYGQYGVSVVSERATFLLSSALLRSSFDWKYFACLTTCWWIFLCQVMCQELAEHSKLITCVHTVKEKQTARHQWYEEWDFISVARDCVVNESAQSAGNW